MTGGRRGMLKMSWKALATRAFELRFALGVVLTALSAGSILGGDPQAPEPMVFTGLVFEDANANGEADDGERGLEGVVVSDGRVCVKTNGTGRFRIERTVSHPVPFVFVTVPSGYRPVKAFYGRIGEEELLFPLAPHEGSTRRSFTFLQLGDVEAGRIDCFPEGAKMLPAPAFAVPTGDLVGGGSRGELEHYLKGMQMLQMPIYHIVGNHDYNLETQPREGIYEEIIGPLYYSWDWGGRHFMALLSTTSGHREGLKEDYAEWLKADLAMVPPEREIVVFRHYPPGPDQFKAFEGRKLLAYFSGHWHASHAKRRDGALDITTAPPNKGGIDHSPRGYKMVTVNDDGIQTEYRYGNLSYHLAVVTPQPGAAVKVPASEKLPVMVNAYHTSCHVGEVQVRMGNDTGEQEWVQLKPEGFWSWRGEIEAGEPGEKTLLVRARAEDGHLFEGQAEFALLRQPPDPVRPADDWPLFLSVPNRHGAREEGLKLPLQFAWSASAGNIIDFGSPVIADGRVYMGTADWDNSRTQAVVAFDARTGMELWRRGVDSSIRHTLACEGGLVFATSVMGMVYAFDGATGDLEWSRSLGLDFSRGVLGATLAANGRVYAGSGALFACLDASSGGIVWQTDKIGEYVSCRTSPSLSGDTVYMGSNWREGFKALDANTGEIVWQTTGEDGFGHFHNSVSVVGDRAYVVGGHILKSFDATTREWLGSYAIKLTSAWGWGSNTSVPLVVGDIAVVGSHMDGVHGVSLKDWNNLWQCETGVSLVATGPYYTDGRATVAASPVAAGAVAYVGGLDGKLYAIEVASGKKLYEATIGSPVLSTAALSGNALYVAALDGHVYCFVESGEGAR